MQRNQQLSLVFYGSRNSITFIANRSNSQPLTRAPNGLDSIVSEAGTVTQQGYAVSFSHRLTQLTGLNLLASRQKNKGENDLTGRLDTTLIYYQAGISTRLGARTVGALNARHQDFSGSDLTTIPYKENALIASVTMVF